ncbi:MAG: minor capsid protein [Thermomicrobiales bacterium]|nr:minor capsid protein [Thermomicrobiales bacterium]
MQRAERRQQPGAARIGKTTADLMKRQRQSILAQLRQRSITRDVADMIEQPFNLARWIREFSIGIRPVLHDVMGEAGAQSMDDLGVGINFDLFDPNVINALEKQVQRFAREVNETTWDRLKDSLGAGYEAGETVDQLAERVNAVMGDRIASSGETIARTESNITHSNADILSWKQSGVVGGKEWLAALDDRTRESHVSAHGQIVGLDEPFNVGGHRMQGPGLGGPASEVVNCRCAMTAVLDMDMPGWEG